MPFHMAESTVGCGWAGEIAMRRVCPAAGQPIKERIHAKQNAKWMHKKLFTSPSNVADKFLQQRLESPDVFIGKPRYALAGEFQMEVGMAPVVIDTLGA